MNKIPRKIGHILIEAGIVSEEQLMKALSLQKETKKPLGEILVEQNFISREKLEVALARQYGSKLGEILISHGLINFGQLRQAFEQQAKTVKSLGDVLIELGYINEEQLLNARAQEYNIKAVKLSECSIDPDAVTKIPMEVLRHYNVLPISAKGNVLTVACSDPGDVLALEDLRFISGMELELVLASSQEIRTYLE